MKKSEVTFKAVLFEAIMLVGAGFAVYMVLINLVCWAFGL